MSTINLRSHRCLFGLRRQREIKHLPQSSSNAAQTLAAICASALVISSAGFGACYAWQSGSKYGQILGGLTVLMAVALEGCKPLAVAAMFSALRSRRTLARMLSASICQHWASWSHRQC